VRSLGSPFDVEVDLGSFRQILTANGTKIRTVMRTLIARHPLCFWMDDVFVGSLMSSPVHTVGANTPLQNAGRLMLEHGIGSVIVVDDDGQLEGILTATDFIRLIAEGDPDPSATVSASMSTDVTTTTANESIQHVADLMVEHDFHHVPVLDEGEVIGVITTTDLTAYLSSREDPSPS
jgi:CBS domain-containing protein